MTRILEALASSVSSMFTDMVKDKVSMVLEVSDEVMKLEGKLHGIKDFVLADADRRSITDEHVRRFVGRLKDVMYDATDIMDLCQLKAMKKRRVESLPSGPRDVGHCNHFLFCLRNPLFAHDIGRRIRELNQRMDEIKKDAEVFNFMNLASYEDRRRMAVPRINATRKTAPGIDRLGVVGEKIKEDTRLLVEMLVEEKNDAGLSSSISSNIKIVAIVGVGGFGKTPLPI